MEKKIFIEQIKSSSKTSTCDLVIKNINIVDVFTNDTYISDVAVNNGYIVGIGSYDGKTIIDGTNKYICPGLIDAHAHIESSLTTPKEYCKAALIHGVTTIIADPHEIGNVLGTEGIELMLKISENLPFNFNFMLPSCVPATPFENSGATLTSTDLNKFYSSNRVLGLAEVMDCPSVTNCSEDMIQKLYDAYVNKKRIDGHGSGLNLDNINTYAAANIRTDHECSTPEEAIDKMRRGFYILMREGTVAKNLNALLKIASIRNSRRICFCTDDKHIDDLIATGSINTSIKTAAESGLDIITAIQMATLNTSECYKLDDSGAIAPGYKADFLILDDLDTFKISKVFKDGNMVVSDNKILFDDNTSYNIDFKNSINLPELNENSLKIDTENKKILNVIEINPNSLVTNHLKINTEKSSKFFTSSIKDDLLKVAVIERHNNTKNIGLGILKGLKLQKGTIATTIAHDSHNLIVCGTNDSDMILAAKYLKEIGGGIVIVNDNKILASVKLELAGLMTNRPVDELLEDLKNLHSALEEISPGIEFNPFLTLSFLSLPVIPDIKITDKGVFDVTKFEFIPVAE